MSSRLAARSGQRRCEEDDGHRTLPAREVVEHAGDRLQVGARPARGVRERLVLRRLTGDLSQRRPHLVEIAREVNFHAAVRHGEQRYAVAGRQPRQELAGRLARGALGSGSKRFVVNDENQRAPGIDRRVGGVGRFEHGMRGVVAGLRTRHLDEVDRVDDASLAIDLQRQLFDLEVEDRTAVRGDRIEIDHHRAADTGRGRR